MRAGRGGIVKNSNTKKTPSLLRPRHAHNEGRRELKKGYYKNYEFENKHCAR